MIATAAPRSCTLAAPGHEEGDERQGIGHFAKANEEHHFATAGVFKVKPGSRAPMRPLGMPTGAPHGRAGPTPLACQVWPAYGAQQQLPDQENLQGRSHCQQSE